MPVIKIKIWECPYIGCNKETTKKESMDKHIDEHFKGTRWEND